MEIVVSQRQGRVPVSVLEIHGNIDAETYQKLEDQAEQAIDDGAHNLLLDLTDVGYLSSYGIRSISKIFKWMCAPDEGEDEQTLTKKLRDGTFKARHLKLFNPSPSVKHVLTLSGIDMLLEIHHDLKKAVNSFS